MCGGRLSSSRFYVDATICISIDSDFKEIGLNLENISGSVKCETLYEDPGPSVVVVVSRPQVRTTGSAHPRPQPTTGKAERRAVVFRRQRACRVLLWSSDDYAAGSGKVVEGGYVLPRRSGDGPAEGLVSRSVWTALGSVLRECRQHRFPLNAKCALNGAPCKKSKAKSRSKRAGKSARCTRSQTPADDGMV
jgi:hypothetical protein